MGIRRNVVINFLGSSVPLLVTLFTVPIYLQLIGEDRFGVLAIVWIFLGYFGLFDLGLGRATNNQIARLKDSPAEDREAVFWTALAINICFGLAGGLVLFSCGQLVFSKLFGLSEDALVLSELIAVLPWLSSAVPIVTMSSVLSGSLEGREKFGAVNKIQVFGFLMFQVLPLTVAKIYGPELNNVIPTVIISRLIVVIILFFSCIKNLPLVEFCRFKKSLIKPLFRFGGWVSVSSIVSPILDSFDRMLIGSMMGAKSITYYTIPFNLCTKINIFAEALTRALFPRFSIGNHEESKELANTSILIMASVISPLIMAGIVLLKPFIGIWISPEMAIKSGLIGQIIFVGVWVNNLAYIPLSLLQGQGKPGLVARIHLCELIPFLLILWSAIHVAGLVGAAIAWSFRVVVDALLLYKFSKLPVSNLYRLSTF